MLELKWKKFFGGLLAVAFTALFVACSSGAGTTMPTQVLSVEELGECNEFSEGAVKLVASDGMYYRCSAGAWNVDGGSGTEGVPEGGAEGGYPPIYLPVPSSNSGDSYNVGSSGAVVNGNESPVFFSSSSQGSAVSESVSPSLKAIKGTMKDPRDGKTYRTVTIGTQTWMAQNLNYGGAADGYCYDDIPGNCDIYGRLYTWEMAMKACPNGWHLPSYDEWRVLLLEVEPYIPDDLGADAIMKTTSGWQTNIGTDRNGSDLFGFSILPAGEYSDGSYDFMGESAVFWCTTNTGGFANHIWVHYQFDGVNSSYTNDTFGMSVRCLKD